MDDGATAGILFFVLLIADIFLFGYRAALDNLNEKEVERRAEEKDAKSIRLLRFVERPQRYWNVMYLAVTLVHVTAGAVFLDLWRRFLLSRMQGIRMWLQPFFASPEPAQYLVYGIATFLVVLGLLYIFLTFGVFLPGKVAARLADRWAYWFLTPISVVVGILSPFAAVINGSVKAILFLFGVRVSSDESDVTEEEIINMVQEGFEQGVIEDSEAEMISNIFAYGDKEAQDIMTHRSNVVAIDAGTGLQDTIDFMLAGTNSRYPVFEENLDHIIGILHMKDAVRYHREEDSRNIPIKDLKGLLREAHFVPQTKKIDELFREMQSQKLQMVIVVDEYGQTDGLVAMEDILEEIVGKIQDEYDEDTKYIQDKGNDEYVMEGKTPLEDLAEKFDINFDGEAFETLNGFLIYRLDHIPEPGEEFDVDYQGYNFKILSVKNKMVQSVLVTKLPTQEAPNSDDLGKAECEGQPIGNNA